MSAGPAAEQPVAPAAAWPKLAKMPAPMTAPTPSMVMSNAPRGPLERACCLYAASPSMSAADCAPEEIPGVHRRATLPGPIKDSQGYRESQTVKTTRRRTLRVHRHEIDHLACWARRAVRYSTPSTCGQGPP